MPRAKVILGFAILVAAIIVGWQFGSRELANIQLQDEMRDMASQAGVHVGVAVPKSDEELVRAVVRKAQDHDIALNPSQVTVHRAGSGENTTISLTADYTAPITLAGFSYTLHFTPASEK